MKDHFGEKSPQNTKRIKYTDYSGIVSNVANHMRTEWQSRDHLNGTAKDWGWSIMTLAHQYAQMIHTMSTDDELLPGPGQVFIGGKIQFLHHYCQT